jgi:FixJ family two-component response regulator/DNA-binding MarR family transcriptional regulator
MTDTGFSLLSRQAPLLLNVLVVEDEPAALDEIRETLDDMPLAISGAANGEQALDHIATNGLPNIIISDIRMPFLGGVELIEALLENYGRNHQCAVIFISGHGDMDTVIRALQLDAVDFLRKPIDREKLRASVRSARKRVLQGSADAMRQLAIVSDLNAFKAQADRLSGMLGEFSRGLSYTSETQILEAASDLSLDQRSPQVFASLIRRLRKIRYELKSFATDGISGGASLAMMLELQLAGLTGEVVSVTSLCVASGGAQTTALRRIEQLEKSGLVVREPDSRDRRRINVRLTDEGRKKVLAYVSSVASLLT